MQDDALRDPAAPVPTPDPVPATPEASAPDATTDPAPADPPAPPVEEVTDTIAEPQSAQAGSGVDASTAPPTAPAPPPGVPAEPVNAEARDGDIPGPRMQPERIGEAQAPPAGDSAPAQS
jgi:hypothetical protein